MKNDCPPDLVAFAAVLNAQPEPVWCTFNYCEALMMVEAGKACLVEMVPDEAGVIHTFETIAAALSASAWPGRAQPRQAPSRPQDPA